MFVVRASLVFRQNLPMPMLQHEEQLKDLQILSKLTYMCLKLHYLRVRIYLVR